MQETMMTARSRLRIRQRSRDRKFQWNLKQMMTSEAMVDVTLACDGQHVRVHKLILAASSSYFRELLSIDKNPSIIFFKDVTYSQIKSIVEYMYTGEISCIVEEAVSLLHVARSLKIEGLADMDLDSMLKKLGYPASRKTPHLPVPGSTNQTSNNTNSASLQCSTSTLVTESRRDVTSTSHDLRSRFDENGHSRFFPLSNVTGAADDASIILNSTPYPTESTNPFGTENNEDGEEEVIILDDTSGNPPRLPRKKIFNHSRSIPANYPSLKSSAAVTAGKLAYSLTSISALKPTDKHKSVSLTHRLSSRGKQAPEFQSTRNLPIQTYSKYNKECSVTTEELPEPNRNFTITNFPTKDFDATDVKNRGGDLVKNAVVPAERKKAKPKRFETVIVHELFQTPSTNKVQSLIKDSSIDTTISQPSSTDSKSGNTPGAKDTTVSGGGDYSRLGLLRLNIRKPQKEVDIELNELNREATNVPESSRKSSERRGLIETLPTCHVKIERATWGQELEIKRRKLSGESSPPEDKRRTSVVVVASDFSMSTSGCSQAAPFDPGSNSQFVLLPSVSKYEPEDTEALENPFEFQ